MDAGKYGTQVTLINNVDISRKKFKQERNSIEVKVESSDEDNVKLFIKKEEEVINRTTEDLNLNRFIKNELVFEPEIVGKENILTDIKQEIVVNGATEELYKDHVIIKEELVIGPEVIQKTILPSVVLVKKEVDKRSAKKQNSCKKCSFIDDNNESSTHKCLYICDYCAKSFDRREKIKQHLNQHVPSKNKCHVCGKSFSFRQNLARHLTIHSGKKPHQCLHCNLTFSRKDYLKVHTRRYHSKQSDDTTDLGSSCELCHKAFSTKFSRDHHIKFACPKNKNKKKQERNKLYVCDICDKSYIYRTSLASHIKLRHESNKVRPLHQCDYCGKEYMKKHNLQCHMLAEHLNIKSYECRKCKERFTWHSAMRLHERKEHRLF